MKSFDTKKIAVVIVGHGSKLRGFDAALRRVAAAVRKDKRFFSVRCAYLAINSPSIREAIRRSALAGAAEVRVLPYFLLSGKHVTRHIPQIVSASKKNFPDIKISLRPYLGYDDRIVSVVKKRIA